MDKGLIVHALIFNQKGEILIIRRSKNENVLPEYWDIPGGTLHDGEDPMDGVARETKEESGLVISNFDLLWYTSNVDKTKNKQFVRLIFIAKHETETVTLNPEEHDAFKWIKPENAFEYKLVDYLLPCFDKLKNENNQIILYSLNKLN